MIGRNKIIGERSVLEPQVRAARRRGDRVRMFFAAVPESAFGTKQTNRVICCLSAFGVKRTKSKQDAMSAFDPKRT